MHPWLSEAIDSVLCQDDDDFEFLIAANRCTDELWSWLQDYAKNDTRVSLFRNEISQLAFNLNLLVDKAAGDYIVRMDSDDVCEAQRIRCLRSAAAESWCDIIGSSVSLISEDGTLVGYIDLPTRQQELYKALATKTAFCHPAVAIRRAFLLDLRGYLGGFTSEDTDLWLRAKRVGATMQNLPEYLLRYRVHNTQSIGTRAGYAEVAGHWLREFLLSPSLFTTKGLAAALLKAVFSRWLPGVRRYSTKR